MKVFSAYLVTVWVPELFPCEINPLSSRKCGPGSVVGIATELRAGGSGD